MPHGNSRFVSFRDAKYFLLLPEIEIQFLDHPNGSPINYWNYFKCSNCLPSSLTHYVFLPLIVDKRGKDDKSIICTAFLFLNSECHVTFAPTCTRVIRNDCRAFNNLSYTIHLRYEYMYFFYLIEQHSKFLLHTLQVLYMCTLCDSANINTIIEFVPNCL